MIYNELYIIMMLWHTFFFVFKSYKNELKRYLTGIKKNSICHYNSDHEPSTAAAARLFLNVLSVNHGCIVFLNC